MPSLSQSWKDCPFPVVTSIALMQTDVLISISMVLVAYFELADSKALESFSFSLLFRQVFCSFLYLCERF